MMRRCSQGSLLFPGTDHLQKQVIIKKTTAIWFTGSIKRRSLLARRDEWLRFAGPLGDVSDRDAPLQCLVSSLIEKPIVKNCMRASNEGIDIEGIPVKWCHPPNPKSKIASIESYVTIYILPRRYYSYV